jgi:hypothetical protein
MSLTEIKKFAISGPAKYIILTGDKDISPNNKPLIDIARSEKNVDGSIVKVILGSQITGEGLDLRFIREIHILDAWFHLNRTEQIIGRGIRFRSHCLIPEIEKRNTTIFLHVLTIPNFPIETADLYFYRSGLNKALLVGKVSRKLKMFAVDCNLRKEVTVLRGLDRRIQIDSQGTIRNKGKNDDPEEKRGILVDDMDFTAICDWMECPYPCIPDIDISVDTRDDSTYTAFSARYRETKLQKIIKQMFALQPFYSSEDLLKVLISSGAPIVSINMTLQGIINNRLFKVKSGSREGYIIYKNKYFLFQPETYKDLSIPLALRIADFPIKRDEFSPSIIKQNMKFITEESIVEPIKVKFWEKITEWVDNIVYKNQTEVGIEIERLIEVYIPGFLQQQQANIHKLKMIILIAQRISEKDILKRIILEYFWDEWLDITTQYSYCQNENELIRMVASENLLESGTYKAYRFVDPNTNVLKLLCEDNKPCPSGIVEAFSRDPTDEIMKRRATKSKTGPIYGFMVPKKGIMVFKTNNPEPDNTEVYTKPNKHITSGQECSIITAKGDYLEKLKAIGKELTKAGLYNLDFDEKHLEVPTQITNSTRGCTLLNLVLRYMDILKVGEKRWFFRPLAAYYSKHIGKISQEARKSIKGAEKELKTKEKETKKLLKEEKAKTVPAKKITVIRKA